MNERIRELAEQASKLSRQEHPELEQGVTLNDILGNTERKVYVVDEVTTQKFAELIIGECLVLADQFEIDVNRSGLVSSIERHFGIEE